MPGAGNRRGANHRRGERGGAVLDAVVFQTAVGLIAALLWMTTVVPNAEKADRADARVRALEAEVARSAQRVAELRAEITALQSDPLYIARVLRRKTRALMPHRFLGGNAPLGATASAGATGDLRASH